MAGASTPAHSHLLRFFFSSSAELPTVRKRHVGHIAAPGSVKEHARVCVYLPDRVCAFLSAAHAGANVSVRGAHLHLGHVISNREEMQTSR